MKIDINNRQQLLAFCTIAVVAIWAGDKLVISPLTDFWKSRDAQIQKLKSSVANGQVTLNRQSVIEGRHRSLLTNSLPSEMAAAENTLLASLDRWKNDSRVAVSSQRPQWKQGERVKGMEEYMTLECRIDATGNMDALARFLYGIESDPLAVKVESADFSSRNPDGMQLTLGLNMSGLQLAKTTQSPK
jgi:hypothetical protein